MIVESSISVLMKVGAALAANVLSSADSSDDGSTSLVFVVESVAIILVAAGVGLIPAGIAKKRRHGLADVVLAGAVLWALLTAGLTMYTTMTRMQWSHEQTVRLESGYSDPRDDTGGPAFPWVAAGGLAIAYAGLLIWANSGGAPPPQRQIGQNDASSDDGSAQG